MTAKADKVIEYVASAVIIIPLLAFAAMITSGALHAALEVWR